MHSNLVKAGKGDDYGDDISSVARRMEEKFQNYWGKFEEMALVLHLALILDPRYMELIPQKSRLLTADMQRIILDSAYALFDEYDKLNASDIVSSIMVKPNADEPFEYDSFEEFEMERIEEEWKNVNADARSELERYLNDPVENIPNFDLIGWWRNQRYRFPVLSSMTLNLLAVPASSTAASGSSLL